MFVAYAHDSENHQRAVGRLVALLRDRGVDAYFDKDTVGSRKSWSQWAEAEIRRADAVVVVGSPECRAEKSTGIRGELAVLRELLAEDYDAALARILPVLLPGGTADDIPGFLRPRDADHYRVDVDSGRGIEGLVRAVAQMHIASGEAMRTEPLLDGPATRPGKIPGAARSPFAARFPFRSTAAGRVIRRRPALAAGVVATIAASSLVVLGIESVLDRPATVSPRTGESQRGIAVELPPDYSETFGGEHCQRSVSPRPVTERLAITAPKSGTDVGNLDSDELLLGQLVKGTAKVAPGEKLWLFHYATTPCLYYVLGAPAVATGGWREEIYVPADDKGDFILYAALVGAADNRRIEAALRAADLKNDESPAFKRLPPSDEISFITLSVKA